jgi:hypothetical protein
MNVGDKVLFEGKVLTVVNEVRPKCRCKGDGYYVLEFEGTTIKVPLTTVLEPFKPLEMAQQKLTPHTLL